RSDIYTLSLHDALPICPTKKNRTGPHTPRAGGPLIAWRSRSATRFLSAGRGFGRELGSRPVGPALRRPTAPRSQSGGGSRLCRRSEERRGGKQARRR